MCLCECCAIVLPPLSTRCVQIINSLTQSVLGLQTSLVDTHKRHSLQPHQSTRSNYFPNLLAHPHFIILLSHFLVHCLLALLILSPLSVIMRFNVNSIPISIGLLLAQCVPVLIKFNRILIITCVFSVLIYLWGSHDYCNAYYM